jgi:hypothetical protein
VGALNSYIAATQDLLHDPLAAQWQLPQIKSYVNEARNRVAQDTKALRQVIANSNYPTMKFTQGMEFINPATFLPPPFGGNIVDILGISITVNQERASLVYKPYSWITAQLRSWVGYQQWPQYWTRLSPIQICIAPVPNQTYITDWDVAVNPTPLVTDATTDDMPNMFVSPVKFWAAKLAKINQQSQGEALFFESEYTKELQRCARAYMQRIIQNPYQSPM